jgi:hypothetical protein
MGLFYNHDPIFFYHKTSQSSTGNAFDGAVTPSDRGLKVKDAWFILTDLGSLPVALAAYKKRMGIEEMFRDCNDRRL